MSVLFAARFEDRAIADSFNDAAWVRTLVAVEAALARAQAQSGIIPETAAKIITQRAATFTPDFVQLEAGTARDGFPIIGLLAQLRPHIGGDAAQWLHRGATTQDIIDTALVLHLATALHAVERHVAELSSTLAQLAQTHRHTVMVGRTHLQPALPITFGLKAAGWLAPFVRHRRRLAELRPRLLVAQCGGAAGTLAALGEQGPAVARAFATELGLGMATTPWHAQRDSIVEAAQWLALVAGSAAKFAQDILLLTQAEIGELRESAAGSRGGSSAMPQKENPIASESILIAGRTVASHLAALHAGPPPEHERGTQTVQTELQHLPRMCALAGGAVQMANQLARELVVDAARMKMNLAATHGTLLAEAATLALARHIEFATAQKQVRDACETGRREGRHLLEILRAQPHGSAAVDELPTNESDYLGSAMVFIDNVLAEAATLPPLPSA